MEEAKSEKTTMRFLSFANNEEDAEKESKLKEAAAKIEEAMARQRALGELVDVKEEQLIDQEIDPSQDTRSLYERLQEQRDKKKESHEEAQKPSNWVTKLDDDDIEYLDEVARKKRDDELRRKLEIQDAFDAKKRLDEQKMLDEQRRMKESLLGKFNQTEKASSANKSRLSSLIKIKSRVKSRDLTAATKSDLPSTEGKSSRMGQSSSASSSQPKESPSKIPNRSEAETCNDKPADETGPAQTNSCSCPKNVMTSIGILPSLPTIKDCRNSSDKESDCSDDEIDGRLVPHRHKRRK